MLTSASPFEDLEFTADDDWHHANPDDNLDSCVEDKFSHFLRFTPSEPLVDSSLEESAVFTDFFTNSCTCSAETVETAETIDEVPLYQVLRDSSGKIIKAVIVLVVTIAAGVVLVVMMP